MPNEKMKGVWVMSEVKVVNVVAVWLLSRKGVNVKHWTRSDERLTMCGLELDGALQLPEEERECVICMGNKRGFESELARAHERLALFQTHLPGQDEPAGRNQSCPAWVGVGASWGAYRQRGLFDE